MAKKKELDLELEDEEMEEETETSETEAKEVASEIKSFKDQVITECTRIINNYVKLIPDDEVFQKGFKEKDINGCINYIMNNLTKKRIYGGDDSLMYEYIHEYYVDNITAEDNWSQYLTHSQAPTPRKEAPKVELTEEQKKVAEERALQNYEAECKAKLIEAERKKAEKEKAKIQKQKEEEAKRKAEEAKRKEEEKNAGAFEQLSLFD